MRLRPRQDVEGERQQPVAGEDRGRLVERLVRGRPAAPQVVIVHRGQVVMHERIAVHEFERGAGHQGALARRLEQRRGLDHQERPQPLAAAEAHIAHRIHQALRPRALLGQRRRRRAAGRAALSMSVATASRRCRNVAPASVTSFMAVARMPFQAWKSAVCAFRASRTGFLVNSRPSYGIRRCVPATLCLRACWTAPRRALVPCRMIGLVLAALSLAVWVYLVFARGWFWLGRERDDARDRAARGPARGRDRGAGAQRGGQHRAERRVAAAPGLSGVRARPGRRRQQRRHRRRRAPRRGGARRSRTGSPIVRAAPLPPRWTGKLWAVKQGIAAAEDEVRAELPAAHRCRHRARARHAALARRARRGARPRAHLADGALRCESLAERVHIPAFIYLLPDALSVRLGEPAGPPDGGRGRRLHAGARRRAARGRRHRRHPRRADRRLRARAAN